MTKYGKTKKLMKETGISKKEAQDYLRRAGWDYEEAKQLWKIKKISDGIVQAFQKLTENLQKATEKMAQSIRKISEAAAAGASKEEIRDRLGITSEEEGEQNDYSET